MKKMISVALLILAGAACIIWAACPPKKCKKAIYHSLPHEDTIELSGNRVEKTKAEEYFKSAKNIKINGNPIKLLACKLSINDIDFLYHSAINLRNISKDTGTHFISALEIKYGICSDEPSKLKLYFKPICLSRQSTPSSGNNTSNYYLPTNETSVYEEYFTYDKDGKFVISKKSQCDNDYTIYTKLIQIAHDGSEKNYEGIGVNDINTVTYSFQEIYALIGDNIPDENYIKLVSIGVPYSPVNGKSIIRHDILLAPAKLPPADGADNYNFTSTGDFGSVSADLTHACPQDCEGNSLTYTMVPTGGN